VIQLSLEQGWYVFSQDCDSISTAIKPTKIWFKENPNLSYQRTNRMFQGKLDEVGDLVEEMMDATTKKVAKYYYGKVQFFQDILTQKKKQQLTVLLTCVVTNGTNYIPVFETFTVEL
jgi:hypothetical protein